MQSFLPVEDICRKIRPAVEQICPELQREKEREKKSCRLDE